MKVAIFNVKYSPNLGDGLLAECLERTLVRHDPDIRIVAVDLAGRGGYGEVNRYRGLMLRTLQRLPGFARQLLSHTLLNLLSRVKLRASFRRAVADSDVVVIGGGNLFADADLNFPIKIGLALDEAARRRLPVTVYAVGVSDDWSATGERLFADGFGAAELVAADVRDERSQSVWNRRLVPYGIRAAGIARDPGLLASRCYPAAPAAGERHVAFGITDPLLVRYHGGEHGGDHMLTAWYTAAIGALADAGWSVTLFTNGSPEDAAFLAKHAPLWTSRPDGKVRMAPPSHEPAHLVRQLASAQLVIAHRMHACIGAYSFRVPAIGLRWDPKLDSFFQLSGRDEFIIDTTATDAPALLTLAERARNEGVAADRHRELLDAASDSVAALAVTLRKAAGSRR
ncbi:polysaccharide pyruvyl transferase family protein [Sphingomonas aracearum]|uniref:polysaccharide pyruvyl transferase family protein n=1 Tax=Sphingomonas aracearum TaxID=2283317 RepID=UPI0015EFF2EB|nr:polysaccharide pyruvyl transferase family protein [Sphingomonas aracearum]